MCKWCLVVYHILSVKLILNGTRVFFSSTGLNWRHSRDFVGPRVLALYPSLLSLFLKKYPFWFILSYSNCVSLSLSLSLSFHQNLRKMEAESSEEPCRDLNELQNDDWVGNWTSDLWPPASTDLKSSSLKAKWGESYTLVVSHQRFSMTTCSRKEIITNACYTLNRQRLNNL